MRILIVVPSQDRISGNWITASRFAHGLETLGHQVALQDTPLQPHNALRKALRAFAPDVALLLHAYRSGKPWREEAAGLGIPYLVLLTGTDVNQGLDDPEQSELISTVLRGAAAVLVQNPLIAAGLTASHPELSANLRVLSPGITLGSAPYDLRAAHDLANDATLFLCPAGLRPVKGLLELLELFDRHAADHAGLVLAFCGPPLDRDYSRRLQTAIGSRPWARYLGAIPPQAMANAMRGADVVVNNSQAEGLPNALLEAAAIGVPILARRIPGNAAVVRHGVNGLLYESAREFGACLRQMLAPAQRRQLSHPDPERYQAAVETRELAAILEATQLRP